MQFNDRIMCKRHLFGKKCHSLNPFIQNTQTVYIKSTRFSLGIISLSISVWRQKKSLASFYNRVELKSLPRLLSQLVVSGLFGFAGQTEEPPTTFHSPVSLGRIKVNFNQISDRMKSRVSRGSPQTDAFHSSIFLVIFFLSFTYSFSE